MIKRITSVLLALLLSLALVTAAFAADGEPIAPAPSEIKFDARTTGWQDFSYIGFHIWGVDGEAFYDWGGKSQRGTDEGDGIWSYDPAAKGVTLDPEKQYAVIFYTDKGQQTYNLLFDTTCFGDVAQADLSRVFENPEDSQKATLPAYWQHQDPTINGPELKISSIGNVVGECCPKSTTREAMFADFLKNTLDNARQYTEQSDQELIDNVGEGLEIGADAVELIIATSGVEVNWSFDASTLCKEPPVPSTEEPTGPDWYEFSACVAEGSGTAKVSTDMWDADAWEDDEGITLTAEPAEGYHFGYWEIIGTYRILEGNLVTPVLLIHPASHITAKAHFIETVPGNADYVAYTVDVAEGEGTASGDKEILTINYSVAPDYQYDTLTLTATPAEGCRFASWTIEGDYVLEEGCKLTDAVITLRAYDGIAARAWFAENVPGSDDYVPYTVDVSVGKGTATGDKEILTINYTVAPDYQYDTLTLTATPAEGYSFYSWDIVGDYTLEEGCKFTDAVITLRAHDSIAAYAQFNIDLPVEPPMTGIRGDADGDGKVTVLDATRIQRYIAKMITEGEISMAEADADGDGKVTVLDATRIQRVLAKLCDMDGEPVSQSGQDQLIIIGVEDYELPIMH